MENVNVKVCQSCGMLMDSPKLYATENNGEINEEYCIYCYHDGAFAKDETLAEMIETCVPFMVEAGKTEVEARKHLNEKLPQLKRWKQV